MDAVRGEGEGRYSAKPVARPVEKGHRYNIGNLHYDISGRHNILYRHHYSLQNLTTVSADIIYIGRFQNIAPQINKGVTQWPDKNSRICLKCEMVW
jgi:hypothetical protein